jgi:hypothetical protein
LKVLKSQPPSLGNHFTIIHPWGYDVLQKTFFWVVGCVAAICLTVTTTKWRPVKRKEKWKYLRERIFFPLIGLTPPAENPLSFSFSLGYCFVFIFIYLFFLMGHTSRGTGLGLSVAGRHQETGEPV